MRFARTFSILMLSAAVCLAAPASAQLEAGREYKIISPVQRPADPSKIEVIEFFSYACPHCYEFEPAVQAWVKRKPKDVEYRMVPMVFRDNWKPLARLFYTLEAMGERERLHEKIYVSIHKEGQQLFTDQAVIEWAKKQGLDAAKFQQVYNSMGIDTKVERSRAMGQAYGVQFTPSVAVNGKYYTGPSMVAGDRADYALFFQAVDQLVGMERGKAAAADSKKKD